MTTCISCEHWDLKNTDRNMRDLGFSRCKQKVLPGHTVSAHAKTCDKYKPLPEDKTQERVKWLAKKG